jgi:hypothetical protein
MAVCVASLLANSWQKLFLAKTLAKSGSVPVVYRRLRYGILARPAAFAFA